MQKSKRTTNFRDTELVETDIREMEDRIDYLTEHCFTYLKNNTH